MSVNAYDKTARIPRIGSRWVWEIESPGARELIEVVEVIWNGEEWWVRTKCLRNWTPPGLQRGGGTHLNDLGRFAEAVTPVGAYGKWENPPSVKDGEEMRLQ